MNSRNILHKDIKPENLLFDDNGYIVITDLGVACKLEDKITAISGTPGYMSPEYFLDYYYCINSDYFSLGVLAYELMIGKRPYIAKNKKELKTLMNDTEIQITKNDIPNGWSLEAADFINRVSTYIYYTKIQLLIKNPEKRLGFPNIINIKNHSWIKDYPWRKLLQKELIAPFIPQHCELNFDIHYVNRKERIGKRTKRYYKKWLRYCYPYDNPFQYFDYGELYKYTYINNTPSTANNTPENQNNNNKYTKDNKQYDNNYKEINIYLAIIYK